MTGSTSSRPFAATCRSHRYAVGDRKLSSHQSEMHPWIGTNAETEEDDYHLAQACRGQFLSACSVLHGETLMHCSCKSITSHRVSGA